MKARTTYVPWRGLVLGTMLGALLCALLFVRSGCGDDDERQRCLNRGGRVLKVHGGGGGWVCEEKP